MSGYSAHQRLDGQYCVDVSYGTPYHIFNEPVLLTCSDDRRQIDVYFFPSENSVESPLANRRSRAPERQMTNTHSLLPFASPIVAIQAVVLPVSRSAVSDSDRMMACQEGKDVTNLALLPQQLEA